MGSKEQTSHQENRFRWSMTEKDFEDKIEQLTEENHDLELQNEKNIGEMTRQLREKEDLINSLKRQIQTAKQESQYHADKTIEVSQNREHEVHEIKAHAEELVQAKIAEMENLANSMNYLKRFNA